MSPPNHRVKTHPRNETLAARVVLNRPGGEQFLTTVECAAILRLSPRTLERMRVQGGGPRYVKAGSGLRSKVLYPMADIAAWTDARTFHSTSEYVAR